MTTTPHPNLPFLRWHAMLREAGFIIPVIIAYAHLRGVTFAEFMAIQSMYMVAMLVLGPIISPLADTYGRRPAAIVGSVFWTLGHIVMWQGYGWQAFAIAELTLAIGIAAYRPAVDALLYDSLASVGKQQHHYAALTNLSSRQAYAGAGAMLVGGWLFAQHPSAPILASIAANLGMVAVAFKMHEAPYAKPIAHPTYANMWRQAWAALSHPATRWVVILPGFITGSTITLFWSVQPLWQAAGLGTAAASALLTVQFILRGVAASQCPRLLASLGHRRSFMLCIAVVAAGFAGMALLPWWASYPLFVAGTALGYILADTMGNDMLHHSVPSSIRSTAAGGYSLVGKLMGITSMGATSALYPQLGLSGTLLVVGTVAMALATWALTHLRAR